MRSGWLLSQVREPLPASAGTRRREDQEYEREGTCNLSLFSAPHEGWRHMDGPSAERLSTLPTSHFDSWRYLETKRIRLVPDNLNMHSRATLYKAFAPAEALRAARRIEGHYTPEQESWLNMCELELSVLARQDLSQRLPSPAAVGEVTAAWEAQRNASGATVQWRFRTEHARVRLARLLYPEIVP